jgi:hypothetical protein
LVLASAEGVDPDVSREADVLAVLPQDVYG